MSLVFHVQCGNCGAHGWTDKTGPGDLDRAVECTSAADDPPGSAEGCCSTLGHTHDEHAAHVRATGDSSARPVTITVGHAGPVHVTGG